MLTDSEKRWLGRRKLYAGVNRWSRFSCQWCEHLNVNMEGFKTPCGACIYGCPRVDMEGNNDDVEFEARVAAKLANIHFGTEDCEYCSNHINVNEYCGECKTASTDKRCLACRLKYASLKVEEEMDATKSD